MMIYLLLVRMRHLCATDDDKYGLLTAVLFVGEVSTVVVSIADPYCWKALAVVGTLEPAGFARACGCIPATCDTSGGKIAAFRHKVCNIATCAYERV